MVANAEVNERRMTRMNECWDNGGFVRVATYSRYTDYKVKHRDMFKMDARGSLYVQRGKNWDCVDYCKFLFSA